MQPTPGLRLNVGRGLELLAVGPTGGWDYFFALWLPAIRVGPPGTGITGGWNYWPLDQRLAGKFWRLQNGWREFGADGRIVTSTEGSPVFPTASTSNRQ